MDAAIELEAALRDLRGIINRLSVVEKQQLPKHGDTLVELLKQGDDFQRALVLPSNPILDRLPFENLSPGGTSLTYMTYLTQVTQPLSVLSVEWETADVTTRSERIKREQDTIENYALPRLIEQFLDLFFYGNSRTLGLHQLIAPKYTRHSGSEVGTVLRFSHFVELIESLRTPELVVSSPGVSALVQRFLWQTGQIASSVWAEVPIGMGQFRGIPWKSTTAIRDTETAVKGAYDKPTGGSCSSVFVLDFAGIQGIQAPQGIQYQSNNGKSRLVWFVGIILPQTHSCGKIDGILMGWGVLA